jgi:murein DD-endopeptidase MepM/ murein hydrolase activator NlpD
MASPVHGEWVVLNPPGHAPLAFDLLATRGTRAPYRVATFARHLLWSIDATEVFGWSRPVRSPVDGRVVACSDGDPDRMRLNLVRDLASLLLSPPKPGSPFAAYGGNHVIIEAVDCFPLLAHLRCGSVRVKAGARVRVGDQIGEVGNSGSSLQPHLHLQVMSSPDPFPLFQNLVPFVLDRVSKRDGGRWMPADSARLHNGDHLRM